MLGLPEEEEWVDVDDAGKSMEGSCASAEAGCCAHQAHTNTEAGAQLFVPLLLGHMQTCVLTRATCALFPGVAQITTLLLED